MSGACAGAEVHLAPGAAGAEVLLPPGQVLLVFYSCDSRGNTPRFERITSILRQIFTLSIP
jgi:hypothetical protein